MITNKYIEHFSILIHKYIALQVDLEEYIQRWLDDETYLDEKSMEELINKATTEIEQYKQLIENVLSEYFQTTKSEMLERDNLINNQNIVQEIFNFSVKEKIVTIKSSHLTNKSEKSEAKRLTELAKIRHRVVTKQISLAEALKLKNEVDAAYNYNQDIGGICKKRKLI